jgi:hypothetical protein
MRWPTQSSLRTNLERSCAGIAAQSPYSDTLGAEALGQSLDLIIPPRLLDAHLAQFRESGGSGRD